MADLDQNNTNKSKTLVAHGVMYIQLEELIGFLRSDGYTPGNVVYNSVVGFEASARILHESLHEDPKPLKFYQVNTGKDIIDAMKAEGETEERQDYIAGIVAMMIGARGWVRIQHRVFHPKQMTRADINKMNIRLEALEGLHFQPPKE